MPYHHQPGSPLFDGADAFEAYQEDQTKRMTFLEECLASQKSAGFKEEDRRAVPCPSCASPGYNTGWGYWAFECGAEIMPDGTVTDSCPLVERR